MLGLLQVVHQRFALALIIFAAALGLWGTFEFLARRAVSGGFRSSFLLMAVLTAAQDLAGLALFLGGRPPHYLLHVVYGIFAIIFLPAVFIWAGRGSRLREAAFLTASCWIALVAYGRGYTTGF
jgi:hypothetical protein